MDDHIPSIPWLDVHSYKLTNAIVSSVAASHPDLMAALVYGSVARHDERPLDDASPSDVDLLLIFRLPPDAPRIDYERRLAINHSIGRALDYCPDPPREVHVTLATERFDDWDPTFIENLAREGIVLWQRGSLPGTLANLASRPLSAIER
ncbi:MAG TPA: nucleotidyltransferase domain-containing protein [Ktedonobacterales bacterium]|nr:nucleotidyltransferase domain-containing protein [Ktedonobacterales bacterium]